jgi:excisionase family DNA binding protein
MTAASETPLVLTVEQTAKLLGISRGLAFAAVRSGEIPSRRVGRRILVPTEQLRRWLHENGKAGGDVSTL